MEALSRGARQCLNWQAAQHNSRSQQVAPTACTLGAQSLHFRHGSRKNQFLFPSTSTHCFHHFECLRKV